MKALAGRVALDLLPAFRAGGAGADPLFLDMWHPSAAGHRSRRMRSQRRCTTSASP